MKFAYLDTNVFIRFITQDHPEHAQRAYHLFAEVRAGRKFVSTIEAVIAEVVYVLSSKTLYATPRQEIKAKLMTVLSLKGFMLPQKRVYKRALDLYASTNLDFPDAYLIAVAELKGVPIMSFDKGIDKISGVSRVEP